MASASEDKTLKIFGALDRKLITTLNGHTDYVSSLSYSPNGKYIATASNDKTVKLWEALGEKLIKTLNSHTDAISCVRYSPD